MAAWRHAMIQRIRRARRQLDQHNRNAQMRVIASAIIVGIQCNDWIAATRSVITLPITQAIDTVNPTMRKQTNQSRFRKINPEVLWILAWSNLKLTLSSSQDASMLSHKSQDKFPRRTPAFPHSDQANLQRKSVVFQRDH